MRIPRIQGLIRRRLLVKYRVDKEVMQRFYDEVVNGRDLDLIDELLREDFVEHEQLEGRPQTREGVKLFFGDLVAAFPDLTFTVGAMLAEGDMAAARIQPGEGAEPQEDEPTRIIEPQGQAEAEPQHRP